jgi:hypothetical protein
VSNAVRWLRSSCPPISGGANASRTQTEVEGDTEMKFRKLLVISRFLMALTTAVVADDVAVDYDHGANFNQVKTYSWSKVQTANSIWDHRVKDAIDKEPTAKAGLKCHPAEMLRW